MIATAGHILYDFDKNAPRIKVGPCHIYDCFGPRPISNYPIPLNFDDAPKFYVHQDDSKLRLGAELGVDLGLIALNSNQVQLLEANGIVPYTEMEMKMAGGEKLKSHIVIGFPTSLQKLTLLDDGRVAIALSPTIAGVDEMDHPPSDLTETEYPRFVGQLLENSNVDIEGMSGGPIIGFSPDRSRYWVVAIQSKWLEKRKITFGCPMPVLLSIIENEIQRSEDQPAD